MKESSRVLEVLCQSGCCLCRDVYYRNSLIGTLDLCTSLYEYYTLISRFFKSSFKGAAPCRKPPLTIPSEPHSAPVGIFFPWFLSKFSFPLCSIPVIYLTPSRLQALDLASVEIQ